MKGVLIAGILLFAGCGSLQPLEEAYDDAVACVTDCDAMWKSYANRQRHAERKAEKEQCPRGYLLTKDGRHDGEVTCSRIKDITDLMDRMGTSRL